MSDAEVTGASTAGSATVTTPRVGSFSFDVDHDRREALPHAVLQQAGLDQVEDHPLVAAARAATDSCIVPGSSGSAACTQSGTSVPAHSAMQISAGVAVAEPAQRGGHVGVLGGERACAAAGPGISPSKAT